MKLFERLPVDAAPPRSLERPLDTYAGSIPQSLLEFWETHGLLTLGGGRLQFVDPERYREVLAQWVTPPPGRPGRIYTPIAVTGFGEVLFVRRLGSEDRYPNPDAPFDLQFFDPHYRRGAFMGWDPVATLDTLDPREPADDVFGWVPDLRHDLFAAAAEKLGPLGPDRSFHSAPALAMGGSESIEHVAEGDTVVHLGLLRDFVG